MNLKILETKFNDHCDKDEQRFKYIESNIESIKNNHLAHIETNLRSLELNVSKNTENIAWIKQIQWFLITTSALTLIGIVVNTYFTLT